MEISEQTDHDWPEVWSILEPVFRVGRSYPVHRDICEKDAKLYWIKPNGYNAIARDSDGKISGIFYLCADQGGPGAHICNAGYVIAEHARGRRLATELCVISQALAKSQGYLAMKFNLVVSTNQAAIEAWKRAGMKIIGTVPKAFRLPNDDYVDAFIMYCPL